MSSVVEDRWHPRAGPLAGSGTIRAAVADFVVDEHIEMDDDSGGEHLWLLVRKAGENTDHVASLLARAAGIRVRDVGYAGRKDRHALTTQWFSLHLPGRADPCFDGLPPSVQVLETRRRRRKLAIGGLRANRFRIVIRDFTGERSLLDRRLAELAVHGAPNHFGVQRFGRGGNNLVLAHEWFAGTRRVTDRKLRGLLLSTARAAIFNAVLAERVGDGSWCTACAGDALMPDGRGSYFQAPEIDATLKARVRAGELHPTGPLWGAGDSPAGGVIAGLERAVAGRFPDFAQGLVNAGLRQERRALRVLPRDLAWEWIGEAAVVLSFGLPPGCYATTLLDEVLVCHDAAGSG